MLVTLQLRCKAPGQAWDNTTGQALLSCGTLEARVSHVPVPSRLLSIRPSPHPSAEPALT